VRWLAFAWKNLRLAADSWQTRILTLMGPRFVAFGFAMIRPMQNALLLIAHGSRRTQSNDEIRALARQVGERAGTAFERVDCAFLELAEPSIGGGIARLAEAGAQHVLVLPYFLSDGRHVHED